MPEAQFPDGGKMTMATVAHQFADSPAARRQGITLIGAFVVTLLFYAVAFPKGGIKIYGIPLTLGYMFTAILLLTAFLRLGRMSVPIDRLLAILPCLLLAMWSGFVMMFNGAESVGFTVAYFVSLLYIPIFGLLFFSGVMLDQYHEEIEKTLLWAIRFVIAYGIFLFLFRQFTGSWIEIPYLTVNVDDVGSLDDKYINRGGIFKLISTYNNGNILGVCLATIAPLYLRLESKKVFQWLFFAAMFLTLSRTVWIGAILVMLMAAFSKGVRPLQLLYLTVGLLIAGTAIVGLLSFLGRDMTFIFDSHLGGRVSQLDVLRDVRVFPEKSVAPLPEIAYLGALEFFGIPGFLLFVAHLLAPSLLLMAEGVRVLSLSKASACLQGLLIYAVVAGADAAYYFIPVMMIFWMVAGLGFWYGHRQAALVMRAREAAR
jgi:hypothetical protein